MQDRPSIDELLSSVENFLGSDLVASSHGSLRYKARVAANVLAMVRREVALEEEHLEREWAGLAQILGEAERPPDRSGLRSALLERNRELCERLREGKDSSAFRSDVTRHLRRVVADKLAVTHPDWAPAGANDDWAPPGANADQPPGGANKDQLPRGGEDGG